MQDKVQNIQNKSIQDNINSQFGKIQLIRTLGKGMSSVVKLGVAESTGKKVAVKILKDDSDKSFDDEITSLIKLDNLHVVKLLGWGSGTIKIKGDEDRDARYIISEYGANGEFFDYISIGEPLSETFARFYFTQLL